MGGLNLHALPCVPSKHQENVKMNRKQEEKDWNPNLKQPSPNDGESTKGWKQQKTNKGKRNKKVRNITLKKLIVV